MEKQLKAFVMDVDGTMTDGKIYMGENGEMFKAFDIKDGYAIHDMLHKNGVITVILTGRSSGIVQNRAKELGIDYVLQGVKDKPETLRKLTHTLGCDTSEMAYIGDDMNDAMAMKLCGIKGCPANAADGVKKICDYISNRNGGDGAIRDFAEWLANMGMIDGCQV